MWLKKKKKNELEDKLNSIYQIGIVLNWQNMPAMNVVINEDQKLVSIYLLKKIQNTIFRLRLRIKELCGGSLINKWKMTDSRRRSREWFKKYDDISNGSWSYKKSLEILKGANLIANVVLSQLKYEQWSIMTDMIDEIDSLIVMLDLEKSL